MMVIGTFQSPFGRPGLEARELEQVDGVVRVVAELDLAHVAAAGEPEADRGAHDSALVQRGIPGALDSLGWR